MDRIRKAILDRSLILDLKAQTIESLVHSVTNVLIGRDEMDLKDRDRLEEILLQRERVSPTALGHSVAVPHVYDDEIKKPVILFVRLDRPIHFDAPDGIPVRFFVFLFGPHSAAESHIDSLAAIARLFSDEEFRYEAAIAKDPKDLLGALDHFESRRLTKQDENDEPHKGPLEYTGVPFQGWWRDIRRRLPHYVSDFTEGLSAKGISSTLFLFFALIAPAVTFGGLWDQATGGLDGVNGGQIGAVELILATAVCGAIWALFSGSPLVIIGGVGPMMVFTGILYSVCQDWAPPGEVNQFFLYVYVWTGLWSGVLLVLLGVFEASVLMKYFTRFSVEIFAALNTLIFIVGALSWIVNRFIEVYQVESDPAHDKALLAFLLMVGTFYISISLVNNRRSRYLFPWVREFFADFGPAISLCLMTLVAVFFFDFEKVGLHALQAPDSFGTTSGRNWFVNPLEAPMWIWFAAIVPAIFNTLLIFLDQNITSQLVNDSKHHLHKGEAYHHDLALSGGLVAGCSLFGLPWLMPASVRTETHIRSLATTEDFVTSGGDAKTRILHVQENRLSPFLIHLLIGCSLFLLPYFSYIPMAVLYGLFLYMGVVSLSSNLFFERVALWATDANRYPMTHYIRRVPNRIVHLYTFIQAACLAMLWLVKEQSSAIGLFFPFVIALLAPIRMLMGFFFSRSYLDALDPEDTPSDDDDVDDEPLDVEPNLADA